jgi:Carbohydrate esterase, sialic acid-specific acetylesterase
MKKLTVGCVWTAIFIGSTALWALLILVLFASNVAEAHDNNVVLFGQSNAFNLGQYGGLREKLNDGTTDANVINCGKPGQHLIMFKQSWSPLSFYGECLQRIGDRSVRAIIFWQGEADTYNEDDAKDWDTLAMQILTSLRNELGDYHIPVVIMAINAFEHADRPYWNKIRKNQLSFTGRNLIKIDSTNYQYDFDLVHLTPKGYSEIADRIALKLK